MIDIITELRNRIHKNSSEHHLNRYIKFIKLCSEVNGDSTKDNLHKHHILPKSMWPDYKELSRYPENGVSLTIRQHYIAHWILCNLYGGKMSMAFWYMININYHNQCRITSKTYERCMQRTFDDDTRKLRSVSRSKYLKTIDEKTGLTNAKIASDRIAKYLTTNMTEDGSMTLAQKRALLSAETKLKTIIDGKTYHEIIGESISKTHNTINPDTGMSPAQKISIGVSKTRKDKGLAKGKLNPMYGRTGNLNPNYGRVVSDEERKRLSEQRLGIPHPTGECTHCGKICSLANLKRWHNDNCKSKP